MRYRGRHLKARPKRRGPVVVATAASITVGGPASAATYVVRKGETLSAIAQRHNTSVSALAKMNRLSNPNLIIAGQRLRIGGPMGSRTHVVRSGDTLSAIAARYRTSVGSLARANGIRDPNLIVVGARLRVPAGGGGGAAQSYHRHSSPSIGGLLETHARAHGVDVALVKAVAWQESGWTQNVRSSAGAIGVMQVMPGTARWVQSYLGGGHDLDVHSASGNIHLGVMYLRHMLDTQTSVPRALAAYYSGPGAVGRRLDPGQRAYARNVLALMKRFR